MCLNMAGGAEFEALTMKNKEFWELLFTAAL